MRIIGVTSPESSHDLMELRQHFFYCCTDCCNNFYGGLPNDRGCWFYAELPSHIRTCEQIIDQAEGQPLSQEEEQWLAALTHFLEYIRELAACHPPEPQAMNIIQEFVRRVKPLILGPLVKPTTGSPADWVARDGVTWEEWNREHDPQRELVQASREVMVRGRSGIWRAYGRIERENALDDDQGRGDSTGRAENETGEG